MKGSSEDTGDYLCFFDNTPKFPSLLLQPMLESIRKEKSVALWPDDTLRLVFARDKISKLNATFKDEKEGATALPTFTLDNSFYCEVVMHKEDNCAAYDEHQQK